MKITAIKQQVARAGRYSIFVDNRFSFGLSADALLSSKITVGQELSPEQASEFKKLAEDDKIYAGVLNYLAIRPRSNWEIESYLVRKKASPTLLEATLNKLSDIGLIDDQKYAEAFVHDRRLLRSSSRRKLMLELRKKRVPDSVIEATVGNNQATERTALIEVIARKRKQSRYKDDLKLMQYLARQGFSYGDIKNALHSQDDIDG